MNNLAILGCGNIARFHVTAMKSCGFNISAISGRPGTKEYLSSFASEFGLNDAIIYADPIDLLSSNNWDAILLSCPTDVMLDYLKLALKKDKPILVEKPVSHKPDELKGFLKCKNIKVAYNRRFYKTVEYAKNFLLNNKTSIMKVTIPESSDETFNSKYFPERLPINSYENSVHVVDLMRYILGDITWSHHESIKNNNNYKALVGIGKSEFGNIVILDSCFNSSDNFAIQLINDSKRLELRPLESAQLYSGIKVVHPTKDTPIRTYLPVLKNQIIETDVDNIKLGFRLQSKDFKNFCDGKDSIAASIYDSYKALKLLEELR
jgi:predicted dehydrogenase